MKFGENVFWCRKLIFFWDCGKQKLFFEITDITEIINLGQLLWSLVYERFLRIAEMKNCICILKLQIADLIWPTEITKNIKFLELKFKENSYLEILTLQKNELLELPRLPKN